MRCSSASKRSTASPASMRFDGTTRQHRSIRPHTWFETWSGRGSLIPPNIKRAAATSVMPENGGVLEQICSKVREPDVMTA